MDKELKFCKYCKYSKSTRDGLQCVHPKNYHIKTNLVFGSTDKIIKDSWRIYPKLQREDGWLPAFFGGTCGKKGRWYVKDLNKFKDEIKKS
jgi:hypothetical protein